MKYLGKAPFSSRPPNDKFREGYERIWPAVTYVADANGNPAAVKLRDALKAGPVTVTMGVYGKPKKGKRGKR